MKITIIGAGAMGGAIAEGMAKKGMAKDGNLTVTALHQTTLDKFTPLGINTSTENSSAIAKADIIILAVKPWIAESVIEEIQDSMDYENQLLVSVVAGIPSETMLSWLQKNGKVPNFWMVIPNTAIAECQSMTFIAPIHAKEAATETISQLFNQLGQILVTDEKHLTAGTALASCGIAYAMRYIRASTEGGVELGFKAKEAEKIVLQTLKGAVALLSSNDSHPEEEIDKVTTPGGMTIKGLNEMEHAGFTSAVIKGLKACLQ